MNDIGQTQSVAFIVVAFVQLLATSGVFLWLIKKISSFGERLASMEAVFDYVKADHDDIVAVKTKQQDIAKDVDQCFNKIRDLETYSKH